MLQRWCQWCLFVSPWVVCVSVGGACVCVNGYLVLLLLLLGKVAAVCVEFDNVLAHVVHSVHQELKALLQVVAGREKGECVSHIKFPERTTTKILWDCQQLVNTS